MTEVALSKDKVIKYLKIAQAQRERALNKFITDYGPSSATVQEASKEVAEMRQAVILLETEETPLEKAINEKK